jgi:hypothetical protein
MFVKKWTSFASTSHISLLFLTAAPIRSARLGGLGLEQNEGGFHVLLQSVYG